MFIGVDTHKDTLAVSCVDPAGREVAQQAFANTPDGHAKLLSWSRSHAPDLHRIGIEGSANFGAGVAHFLYQQEIDVREVPAKLTGRERTRLRRPGKTDPTDALAIARITARDPDLPPARRRGCATASPAAVVKAGRRPPRRGSALTPARTTPDFGGSGIGHTPAAPKSLP